MTIHSTFYTLSPHTLSGVTMKTPEVGITIGAFDHGERNTIADVAGVRIGHVTCIEGTGKLNPGKGPVRTGVTAVLPHRGNIFKEKLLANAHVINGYAKPIGLIQLWEHGVIETPIILTNTLSVGTAAEGLIRYMITQNEEIGAETGTVNPVVLECNDAYLNDIRGLHITKDHVREAIERASKDFDEGAVGAGTGMSAFELKSGIGSSSRIVEIEGNKYTLGALVLSNFGKREDLTIAGVPVGKELMHIPGGSEVSDGSIIMIVATDAPLSVRQLGRVAKRSTAGLARTGGHSSDGSGDIALVFSTAQQIRYERKAPFTVNILPDSTLTPLFKATTDVIEEAIVNALLEAETMEGRDSHVRNALPLEELREILDLKR